MTVVKRTNASKSIKPALVTPILAIGKILSSNANGISEVFIKGPAYNAILTGKPSPSNPSPMAYTRAKDSNGVDVRVFDFNGVKVYLRFAKAESGYYSAIGPALMHTKDAEKLLSKSTTVPILNL